MKFRSLSAALALLLAAGLCATAGSDTAKKLVGTWESKGDGKAPAATLQLMKDGKLKITVKLGDKSLNITGTYSVKDDVLSVNMEADGKTKTDMAKIKKLTAKELQIEKDDGRIEEYRRKK